MGGMKLLVLGGTRFLGRHLAGAALAAGHKVALFNRGLSGPGLFPQAERLRGDRDGGLSELEGRRFDAVVDTSGYVPRVVRASAELLAPNAGHYTFVSWISVYREERPGVNETAPVATLADESVEEVTDETYGALKALCEREVLRAFPGRSLIVRPGLIVGPFDPTDRFTYWPVRVARGGEVLAPDPESRLIQIIDGRDLAGWILEAAERGTTGPFNATGPAEPLTMGSLLDACLDVGGNDTRFTWVAEEFLLGNGVGPWVELPLWTPDGDGMKVSIERALASGMTFRPLSQTIADTLLWAMGRHLETEPKAGLARDRESALLAAWNSRVMLS
jgi:2'-hydroxyisoflavone reductase